MGRGKKVIDNLVKFGITDSASKFAADYNGRLFAVSYKREDRCGISIAEDNRLENMGEMNSFIADELKGWPESISYSMRMVFNDTGTGEDGEYSDTQPSQLAVALLGWYPTAQDFREVQTKNAQSPDVIGQLRTKMTNTIIQRAWAAQQCYLQCAANPKPGTCEYLDRQGHPVGSADRKEFWCPPNDPNTICQAVCWESGYVDVGNVPLYGVDDLTAEAWSLNATDIYRASWQAYRMNATASYEMVHGSSLTTWSDGELTHGSIPLLPVTYSQYTKVQDVRPKGFHKSKAGRWTACNVGDRWGNESLAFWRADQWQQSANRPRMASRCRDNMNKMLGNHAHPYEHPGIYYANQCRVLAYLAYPASDKNFLRTFRVPGDRERAIKTLQYVDSTVPRLRSQGKSEDEIEVEITRRICEPDTDLRRKPKATVHIDWSDASDDADEGYAMTLHRTDDGCKKWRKQRK